MKPRLRKVLLTFHIILSVSWIGAVAGFLALSIAGLTSGDAQVVRAVYMAMSVIAWFVIVPMSLTALVSGVIQALATEWGLFRHYWVLAKLVLTTLATVILLIKMRLVDLLADEAARTSLSSLDLRQQRLELVFHAGGGLVVLIVITVLSVFKPWGRTRFWKPKAQKQPESAPLVTVETLQRKTVPGLAFKIVLALGVAVMLGIAVSHLLGSHGPQSH